ncbi:hypothetical protein DEO72_LG5g1259 [Vigna unguiculata]|uniref:Uncharacterized protein n=1 Tax=Vigna unguiculata TaxID=3917 RepID=A0A4D6LWY2_VIGUN|nr:hypothetical protein DEO72_LG5g1259 [Vigna unguiculata]
MEMARWRGGYAKLLERRLENTEKMVAPLDGSSWLRWLLCARGGVLVRRGCGAAVGVNEEVRRGG